MAETKFRCMMCDKDESRCECDKYCVICQGFNKVRLVGDGMYYCEDCRQACGYKTEEETDRTGSGKGGAA